MFNHYAVAKDTNNSIRILNCHDKYHTDLARDSKAVKSEVEQALDTKLSTPVFILIVNDNPVRPKHSPKSIA